MAEMVERILLLKRSPLFAAVDSEDLQAVAEILEEERWRKGETIFRVGDSSDRVFIVRSGQVEIEAAGGRIVNRIGPDECFGEMGAFDDMPRSASARAVVDCVFMVIDKPRLHGLIANFPQLAIGMLRTLNARLRDMTIERTWPESGAGND